MKKPKSDNAGGGGLITKKPFPTVAKLGLATAGFGLGAFGMKAVPDFGYPIVKKLVPGAAGIAAAIFLTPKVSDPKLKALLMGLGLAGFVDLYSKNVKPLLANVPFLSDISESVPSLGNGVGPQTNTGDYPPSYYYKNAFQGPADGGYQLKGFSMQGPADGGYQLKGFSMQGAGSYALN